MEEIESQTQQLNRVESAVRSNTLDRFNSKRNNPHNSSKSMFDPNPKTKLGKSTIGLQNRNKKINIRTLEGAVFAALHYKKILEDDLRRKLENNQSSLDMNDLT